MTSIYEPIYKEGQTITERAFKPLYLDDNSHAAWREFWILVSFYRDGKHKGDVSGVFSPKFEMKSKISADDFIKFCKNNKESDVCFINPFPQISYYSYNVWMQGEENHPGITAVAQELLNKSGINWDLSKTPRHGKDILCYSNFWVGNDRFWEAYVGGVLEPIADYIEKNPDSAVTLAAMGETWHSDSAPFLPFIIERLFSTFLSFNKNIRSASFNMNDDSKYCLTSHEKIVVESLGGIISEADSLGKFSEELKVVQRMCCKLIVNHATEHFSKNIHPHTGKVIQ